MDSFSVPLIQCGERHECFVTREEFLALEKKLSSATKRATCFVAILCAVIALLLVVAGVTGVYVYMVTQSRSCETSDVNRNHGDISRLPELSHFEPRSGLVAEENGHQATDETEHIRQKRSKPKKTNACKCGRELKRIRRQAKKEAKELEKSFEKHTERLESLESKLRNYSVLTPNSNGTYIGAAHYATYVDNDIISKHLGNLSDGNLTSYTLCKNVSILSGGMLCRNRTLIANGERAKLNVFREAKWMKTTAETPIFRQRKDGSFKAVRSGIYHVYAHGIGGRTRRSAERKSQQNRGGKRNRKNRKEQTPSRRTDRKGKKDKKISLPVAQYIGSLTEAETRDLVDLQFDSYKNIETCRQIETMGGKLCLNRTFVPSTEPLNIFKTASWEGDKASPLDKHGSFFQAKSSGIHLVFAQIVFAGFDNVKSASIIQKRGETSIDSLNCYTGSFGEETKKQTCTIVGLLNIRRGDVIKLISNNKYAAVLRADGDTYFGVVQLTQQKSDKRS